MNIENRCGKAGMNMIKEVKLTFHHIGKIVPIEKIKDDPNTKYSSLFDMYSLDKQNDLMIPIELHAFGSKSSLDIRIQQEDHVAFKVDCIEKALLNEEIVMPLYQPFAEYRCAMIRINEQLIEVIETSLTEREIWGDGIFKDSLLYPTKK